VRWPDARRPPLGGKDNFAADRQVADGLTAAIPSIPLLIRDNRAFLGRAVGYLAREAGIRQFLDIGTGIPTGGNTHEVAQAAAPDSRIVYVDNDPIVLAHARALMAGHPAGATAFIQEDFREPGKILADPALRATLDLDKPVALMLIAILHFFADDENPQGIVSSLVDALPSGSSLTITHLTADFMDADQVARARQAGQQGGITYVPRSQAQVAAFFRGLDLVEPGVVPCRRGGRMPARRPARTAQAFGLRWAASRNAPRGASLYPRYSREELGGRPGRHLGDAHLQPPAWTDAPERGVDRLPRAARGPVVDRLGRHDPRVAAVGVPVQRRGRGGLGHGRGAGARVETRRRTASIWPRHGTPIHRAVQPEGRQLATALVRGQAAAAAGAVGRGRDLVRAAARGAALLPGQAQRGTAAIQPVPHAGPGDRGGLGGRGARR
jgi:S-adenosyl methyltransferase